MTANQIAYWNLKESERSNKAREAETQRHNYASEAISWADLDERNRHNIVTEVQSGLKLREDIRHNKADEKEKSRHNQREESIKSEYNRQDLRLKNLQFDWNRNIDYAKLKQNERKMVLDVVQTGISTTGGLLGNTIKAFGKGK